MQVNCPERSRLQCCSRRILDVSGHQFCLACGFERFQIRISNLFRTSDFEFRIFSTFLLLTGFAVLLKSRRPFKNERAGVRRQIVSNLKKRHSVILPVQSSPLSFLEQT
jgi:hypothetical protein